MPGSTTTVRGSDRTAAGHRGRARTLRWLGLLAGAVIALASPASASAARLYVAVGDSVGAGFGATSGQSYFDLYCGYLKSAAGGSSVDQCVNESISGLTSQSALDDGVIQRALNDINGSSDTPVVTVVLGGNDLLGSPGCMPITGAGCEFIHNMRTILNKLELALAAKPGPHRIQWLEYYNANHDNPFGNSADDGAGVALLLGSDSALTDCTSFDLGLIGLNDVINCIAREKGATPVDAYTPFQASCTSGDCFSDALHPNDKGYGLIFDALRDTPGSPVPAMPPPDGTWPFTLTPQDSTPPTVAGPPFADSLLSCVHGTWLSSTAVTFAYQWLRDGSPIQGGTSATYLATISDVGHRISCRVTASDATGSAAATTGPITVEAAAMLISVAETRKVFRPGPLRRKRGEVFRFALNDPADVVIAIKRELRGRRVNQRCRPPAPFHGPRCVRTVLITTLRMRGNAGLNKLGFSGIVRGRALRPGRYQAIFRVVGPFTSATPRTLYFRVIRA